MMKGKPVYSSRYLICATGVVIDQETNNVTIFNVIEQLNSATFPLIVPQITVISNIERSNDEPPKINYKLRIKLDKELLSTSDINVDFQNSLRNRAVITINGFVVPRPGELEFSVQFGRRKLSKYTIQVQKIGKSEAKILEKAGS